MSTQLGLGAIEKLIPHRVRWDKMQNTRFRRSLRSATTATGHSAACALGSSTAHACCSLGGYGQTVSATLDPPPPHSINSTINVAAAEQVVAQGARPRRSAARVRHQEADCQRTCMEPADESPRPADAPVGALAPDLADPEPAGELTVAALQEHACKIFVSDAGEPVASHGPPLATESTSLLVKLALEAIRSGPGVLALPARERVSPLGYALDDEEALGYLLGDALGHPLDAQGARAVGKRAGKHYKQLKPQLSEAASRARKAARKAAHDDPESIEDAASLAQVSLLTREFDLKLPPAAPAAATSLDAASHPRSHKRKQPAHSPHPPREEAEEAAAEAMAESNRAINAMKIAQATCDAAVAKQSRMEATQSQLGELPAWSADFDDREERAWERLEAVHSKADDRTYDARQAAAEACTAFIKAKKSAADSLTIVRRMATWLRYPPTGPDRVLTPFPWPEHEYVEPCNEYDLSYYRNHKYRDTPVSVSKWLETQQVESDDDSGAESWER